MPKDYPLIRIPTQPARVRLVDVVTFLAMLSGIILGGVAGMRHFGVAGAVIGLLAGGFLGFLVGRLPDFLVQERLFREMQKSSNEQLKAKLEQPMWTFYQTLALLNLQLRGEDVQPYLPRILTLLESDESIIRVFARDALRLVFTPLGKQLDDLNYDPRSSASDCRVKIASLRAVLK
jgi:hypothetical protein